jgi:hypothetical protein
MSANPATSFPLMLTVRDSYRDVFGNIKGFFKTTWLIWALLLVCVEIPASFVAERIRGEMGTIRQTETFSQQVDTFLEDETALPAPRALPEKTAPEVSGKPDLAPPGAGKPPATNALDDAEHRVSLTSGLMMMLVNLVQVLILFAFVVAWYRNLLLHEKKGETVPFRIGRNEWHFAWTNMKASLFLMPIFFIATSLVVGSLMSEAATMNAVDSLVFSVAVIAFIYVQARLTLSYPMTAIGKFETPIQESWNMTKDHVWRIACGNILIILPMAGALMVFAYILSLVVGLMAPPPESPVPDDVAGPSVHFYIMQYAMHAFGSYFTIFFLAVISAFHARVYAMLVRGQKG